MLYFETPKIKRIELKFAALLRSELDFLPEKLNAKQIPHILEHIQQFTKECHKFFNKYVSEVLKQHKTPVSCKHSCQNCCRHYPMSIEPFELITLYFFLRNSPKKVNMVEEPRPAFSDIIESCWKREMAYLKIRNEIKNVETALRKYFSLSIACPFLIENGNCGIYELRPFTCRMYFSITNPKFCAPAYIQTAKNKSFVVYLPDILENLLAQISERYEELELPESLYGGLAAVNKLESLFAD